MQAPEDHRIDRFVGHTLLLAGCSLLGPHRHCRTLPVDRRIGCVGIGHRDHSGEHRHRTTVAARSSGLGVSPWVLEVQCAVPQNHLPDTRPVAARRAGVTLELRRRTGCAEAGHVVRVRTLDDHRMHFGMAAGHNSLACEKIGFHTGSLLSRNYWGSVGAETRTDSGCKFRSRVHNGLELDSECPPDRMMEELVRYMYRLGSDFQNYNRSFAADLNYDRLADLPVGLHQSD